MECYNWPTVLWGIDSSSGQNCQIYQRSVFWADRSACFGSYACKVETDTSTENFSWLLSMSKQRYFVKQTNTNRIARTIYVLNDIEEGKHLDLRPIAICLHFCLHLHLQLVVICYMFSRKDTIPEADSSTNTLIISSLGWVIVTAFV